MQVADGIDARDAFDRPAARAYIELSADLPRGTTTRRLVPMTIAGTLETWTEALRASHDRVLAAAETGRYRAALLTHATAGRIVAAWTLAPAPRDPSTHLDATHARCRRNLERLLKCPSGAEVRSPMTGQLYTRLTQPSDPAQQTDVDYTVVEAYTYTPRKPLRRVLDHSLDHLNQIEQWRRWRHEGEVPTPTDGWVGSTVTVPEDRLPLTPSDLDAWLWRIDLAMGLLVERARRLGDEELDWQPPDGGWTLRRVLHHVARSEVLYATSFDDALPEDPAARYAEADARLGECLTEARERAGDPSVVFPDPYGTFFTLGGVVAEVVALEHELLIQTT